MKTMFIKADTNDADYITRESVVTDDILEDIMPVILAIKENKKGHNWPTGEQTMDGEKEEMYPMLTTEQIEDFDSYVPHGDYGTHTIASIKIFEGEPTVIIDR